MQIAIRVMVEVCLVLRALHARGSLHERYSTAASFVVLFTGHLPLST